MRLSFSKLTLRLSPPRTQPVESHVAALVDVPNAMVTVSLPTAIFDRDILPHPDGLEKRDYGNCALRSDGLRSFDLLEANEEKAKAGRK